MRSEKHILTVVIALVLISFMSLSFAASYSYVTKSKIGGNLAQITTTNMNFTSTMTGNTGVEFSFDSPYNSYAATITINKPAGYDTLYYVLVGHNTTGQATLLPYEHVVIQTNGFNSILADNPVYTPSSATYSSALYTVFFGILNSSNSTKTLTIKAAGATLDDYSQIDTSISNFYDDTVIMNIAAQVYQYPLAQRNLYNISGHVYDSSSNPVTDAVIRLQNGSAVAFTDENGAFTLNNIPNGTWRMDIFSNSVAFNKRFSTTIRVYAGSSVNVTTTAGSSYASGNYLQKAAYAKYTTPYKILKNNSNITTNSNYAPSVSYTTPPYYNIIGIDSLEVTDITNVNITLNDDSTLTLSRTS